MSCILGFAIVHLLAQITPHALHHCIDLVHRAASHNHRAWEPFKRHMRHTHVGTPRRHITVKVTIRYVCEWPKKCAARAQGDGTLRWIDVGESSKSAMGGAGNPVMTDESCVLYQIAHEGEGEGKITSSGVALNNDVLLGKANGPSQIDIE
jgi:hypothetical protein